MGLQRSATLFASCAFGALMVCGVAHADTATASAASATAAPSDATTVGDIVVTAQHRSERLQDVPMTVEAYTADQITQRSITSLDRLTTVTPSVQIGGFSDQKPILYIRGIGTRQLGPGADQSVGVFIDDFYMGDASVLLGSLTDISRIEVLKGPQGTLYGRNTIAGAISVVTADPTTTPSGTLEGSVGNYDLVSLRGAISGPIAGDQLTGRVSFYATRRDGYEENLVTGGTGMGEDRYGVRAKFLYRPNDRFTATLSLDYNKDNSPGQLAYNLGPGFYLKNPALPAPPRSLDPLKSFSNIDPTSDGTNYGANLKLQWDTGAFMLTSLTQARASWFHDIEDNDMTQLNDLIQNGQQHDHSFSQELRASSEPSGFASFNDRLTWQLGLFYFRQTSNASDIFEVGPDSLFGALAHHTIHDTITSGLTAESYAAYGEATLKVTEQLRVTGGLRYTHDDKNGLESGATDSPGFPFVTAPFRVPVTTQGSATNPKVTIAYFFTPLINVYGTYEQGYKSGGFQYLATSPTIAALTYGPETVDYYEVGLKSQLLDRHLTLDVAAFKAKYKGLQLGRSIGTSFFTDNAASVDMQGIEAEAHAVLPHGFSIDASYTYLDNKFGSYDQCTALSASGCGIFDGTMLPRSPKNEVNLGGEYFVATGNDSDLTLRADLTYRSKYILDAGGIGGTLPGGAPYPDNPFLVQNNLTLLDLRATYRHADWKFSVWGTNVTNEIYGSVALTVPSIKVAGNEIGNTTIMSWAPPRMFGATVAYSF